MVRGSAVTAYYAAPVYAAPVYAAPVYAAPVYAAQVYAGCLYRARVVVDASDLHARRTGARFTFPRRFTRPPR